MLSDKRGDGNSAPGQGLTYLLTGHTSGHSYILPALCAWGLTLCISSLLSSSLPPSLLPAPSLPSSLGPISSQVQEGLASLSPRKDEAGSSMFASASQPITVWVNLDHAGRKVWICKGSRVMFSNPAV